jgi:hypothetical protein
MAEACDYYTTIFPRNLDVTFAAGGEQPDHFKEAGDLLEVGTS